MRILQIHTRYREAGGEDTAVANEAALLRRHGHEVITAHAENPRRPVDSLAKLAMAPWNPVTASKMRRLVDRVRPDVTHVHNTWFALSPSVISAARRAGSPVVVSLHNFRLLCANAMLFRDGGPCEDCVGSHPWHAVRHRCYRSSALASVPVAATIAVNRRGPAWQRDVHRFLVLNEFARAVFERGGVAAERLRVKPNGVADPGPRPAPPSRSDTVVYIGRLSAEKGLHTLLEAWAGLGRTSLQLELLGAGPQRSELERSAPPGVRFTGQMAHRDVLSHLQRARALVLPSLVYEGQPMSVLEGLAAGLPPVVSDHGGTAEIAGALGPGHGAPPGQPEAWRAALARLHDDAFVDAAGARARALYEERYTEAIVLEQLEQVYADACAAVAT
jgi:glycosyltransferase involved in cell wall biosynthesis